MRRNVTRICLPGLPGLPGLLALAALLAGGQAAQANDIYGFGMPWGGITNPSYSLGGHERPPYFALHPPVYYSQPVARTYGYSPFPYPGTVMTPEVELTGPKEIINPYVPQEEVEAKPASDATASRVQVIVNPFVHDTPAVQLSATVR